MNVREAWEQHRGRGLLKLSNYPEPQHRHLARFQGQPVTMLEIGVLKGGSLDLWRQYFGPQATLIGIDISPDCANYDDPGSDTHVRIGDQTDREFLGQLAEEFGPFDIVSDDGGHMASQQVASFEALWPSVRDGGVYICEDSFTGYDSDFIDGPTFIELAKHKVDEIHAWCGPHPPTEFTRQAQSICFYFGLVVIEKGAVEVPQLMGKGEQGIVYGPLPSVRFT